MDKNQYNTDIIDQLIALKIGTKNEIIMAMDNVVNKNDINEISEYLTNSRRLDRTDNKEPEPQKKPAIASHSISELTIEQKLQLAERANEIYRQQLVYMNQHLVGLRSVIKNQENVIKTLMEEKESYMKKSVDSVENVNDDIRNGDEMPSPTELSTFQKDLEQRMYDINFVKKFGKKCIEKIQELRGNAMQFIWKIIADFDTKDETNDISLLSDVYNDALYMCSKGHAIYDGFQHMCGKRCVQCGHSNSIKKILPNDAEVMQFLNKYDTSIKMKTNVTSVGWFKQHGYDTKYPLHYAAHRGDIESIKEICSKTTKDINAKMSEWKDFTPIMWAINGHLEAIVELIKYGADPFPLKGKQCNTPLQQAAAKKYYPIVNFFNDFASFKYGINAKDEMYECSCCYRFDYEFDRNNVDLTREKYVYCKRCATKNLFKVKEKKQENKFVANHIVKTLRQQPHLAIDTLCGMRDKRALEKLLKDIMVWGSHEYWTLYLLDLDFFKKINSALSHHGADLILMKIGNILKHYEAITKKQWLIQGVHIDNMFVFRQGGDEFAILVKRPNINNCRRTQDIFYGLLRRELNSIKIEKECYDDKANKMDHLTFSVGVLICGGGGNYDEWLRKADEAAEIVKKSGRDGLRIIDGVTGGVHKNFNDVKHL